MFGFFPGVAGVGVVGCVSRGCGWSYCVSRDVFSARHNKPGSFPPLLYTVLSCAHAALVGGKNPCVSPWLLLFQHVSSFGVGWFLVDGCGDHGSTE